MYQRLRQNLASHVAGFDSTAGHRPRACALSQFLKKLVPVAVVARRSDLLKVLNNIDPAPEVGTEVHSL